MPVAPHEPADAFIPSVIASDIVTVLVRKRQQLMAFLEDPPDIVQEAQTQLDAVNAQLKAYGWNEEVTPPIDPAKSSVNRDDPAKERKVHPGATSYS